MTENKLDNANILMVGTKEGLKKILTQCEIHKFNKSASDGAGVIIPHFISPLPILNEFQEKLIKKRLKNKTTIQLKELVEKELELGTYYKHVTPHEAVHRFTFDVGHTPVDGSIYVKHPIIKDAYIRPEDFSRVLSKEKESAFRQLASCLGAKRINLVDVTIKTKKGLFSAKTSLPKAAADIGIDVQFDKSGNVLRRVYSEFGNPRREPWVPEELKDWIKMDSDLRTMVRDRIDGNVTRNMIHLEFKEGLGVSGSVAATVANKGLSVSSSYEAMEHTVWYFDVEYYET